MTRVALIAGVRTPFVKAGKAFNELGPLRLARKSVRGLLDRHEVDPEEIDAIAYGVVVPEPGKPNLAREIIFEENFPSLVVNRPGAGARGCERALSSIEPTAFVYTGAMT